MKTKKCLLAAFAIMLLSNTFMYASASELDNKQKHNSLTMKLAKKEGQRGNRVHMRAHHIILNYKLKNGDITQDEIELMVKERKQEHKELRHLKKSGNNDIFEARLAEIKEKHKTKRAEVKQYINAHPELEQTLRDTYNKRHGKGNKKEYEKGYEKSHGRPHYKDRNKPDHHFDEDHKPQKPYRLETPEENNSSN